MKAVLSNRIYMEVTPELKSKLLEALSYNIPPAREGDPPITMRNLSMIRGNIVSIPSGREDLIPNGYEIVDKRSYVPCDFPEFQGTLRPSQQEIYDQLEDSCIINAWVSFGKAQPLRSKIRVPGGWTTMGEIQEGDTVVTPDSSTSKVTGKFLHSDKAIYKITTMDGRVAEACEEHLWDIYIRDSKVRKTVTTAQIKELLSKGKVVSLPRVKPIDLGEDKKFIIHPYVLGILLGDGSISTSGISISSADSFIIDKVNSLLPEGHKLTHASDYDYRVVSVKETGKQRENLVLNELRELNLLGRRSHDKFIPEEYKNLNLKQTMELLQGLLDSDGSVTKAAGSIEYCSSSKQLMHDFCDMIYSIGGNAKISSRIPKYTYKGEAREGKISYRTTPGYISWDIKKQLCSLPRKVELLRPGKLDNSYRVRIQSVEYVGREDCACISIDSKESLYITNQYLATHNTFTALAIAGKLKQKTLVVTHTVALRNQWVKEIKKTYGFTPGIIGSGEFNLDTSIVVGNVQSLYKKIPQIAKEFGTIILDEMHHVSSPTFSKIIDKSYARYKIGLSGTIERKDGKHVVFIDYFSPRIFKPPPENFMVPVVHLVESHVRFPDGSRTPWAKRINELAFNEEYQHSVAIMAAAYAAKGHKVLVVSDRVRFLKSCAELVGENAISVTGSVPHEQREILMSSISSGEKEVLFGTQSIFSEGISLNELSCLILATPINNDPLLTQLCGRILRKKEGKKQPVIVDIQLKGNTAKKQAKNRTGFYLKQGWEIKTL